MNRIYNRKAGQNMNDIEKARQLFQEAGLAFPTIPDELAVRLRKRREWHFSTRTIETTPYFLKFYVDELNGTNVKDYALLAHSGHGINSWAIHYYIVFGPLLMFLQLAWGGIYMDVDATAAKIRECFLLADQIVSASKSVCKVSDRITIVCSDFLGSYLDISDQDPQVENYHFRDPAEVLNTALQYLRSKENINMTFMEDVRMMLKDMDVKERDEFLAMAEQIDREEDRCEQRKIIYLSDYRRGPTSPASPIPMP